MLELVDASGRRAPDATLGRGRVAAAATDRAGGVPRDVIARQLLRRRHAVATRRSRLAVPSLGGAARRRALPMLDLVDAGHGRRWARRARWCLVVSQRGPREIATTSAAAPATSTVASSPAAPPAPEGAASDGRGLAFLLVDELPRRPLRAVVCRGRIWGGIRGGKVGLLARSGAFLPQRRQRSQLRQPPCIAVVATKLRMASEASEPLQKPAPSRACGFKSRLRHHLSAARLVAVGPRRRPRRWGGIWGRKLAVTRAQEHIPAHG